MAENVRELRIGLVLYGGVSLAVYMNGIVTELWHILRASKALRGGGPPMDGLPGVYAELLQRLESEAGGAPLRVVVDAVAGTSAGGVNGAVLAKAVLDGGNARILNDVWIWTADIEKLKREPAERAPWYLRAAVSGAVAAVFRRCASCAARSRKPPASPGSGRATRPIRWPARRTALYRRSTATISRG